MGAVVLLAFSVPKLYELKKPEIDRGISQASDQAQRFNEQVIPLGFMYCEAGKRCQSRCKNSVTGAGNLV